MADNPRSSQQELSKDVKKDTLGIQNTSHSRRITEEELVTEITKRIYRKIANKSSLENDNDTDVGDANVCLIHGCPEPDKQSNEKL